jgi:hypothetical protein
MIATDGAAHSLEELARSIASPGEPLTDVALELARDTLSFMDHEGLLLPA